MKESIGIFQGKQKKYNTQILNTLYNNGPLTSWEITKKITDIGKITKTRKRSLHPTLYKRLRVLEKKGYLSKEGMKWCLRFKGIIAGLLIQENPKPLSNKWIELVNEYVKFIERHCETFNRATIHINGDVIKFAEIIDQSLKIPKTLEDWIALSNHCKELMQKGVIDFDVISEQTLFSILISEALYPKPLMNNLKIS